MARFFWLMEGGETMASALDVAAYILHKKGCVTSWKLQKLIYYSQAWSLVWDGAPIFDEPIEAWANGPVVRHLFEAHKGQFLVSQIPGGNPDRLTPEQKESIDVVIDSYGDMSPQYLSDLTHMEDPWILAREGIPAHVRSDRVISLESMAEYYESLLPDDE